MVKTPILVFCRIRPSTNKNSNEIQEHTILKEQNRENLVIFNHQNNSVLNNKPDSYNFQFIKVFEDTTTQNFVYENIAQPVIERVLKGYNGTIFAYGQTGSGKTFTISGDKSNPGIVPRALFSIFEAISQAKDKYDIQMSYLEIYNEHSNDLLIPVTNEKKKILLRESSDKIMEWHNLSLIPVRSYSEALELIAIGDNNRIICDTPMNLFSSRSHTILTIYVAAQGHDDFEIRKSKLNLVDLAGSERVHKTCEEGIVLEEAKHINLSLHYLEQVIVALSDTARSHVPYRNCTMTSALRDSLGGNCMTAMIANIAVDKSNIEETLSTCRFAQRVAMVRNYLTVNSERDFARENNLLREEIQQLRKQCSLLQSQVQEFKNTKMNDSQHSKSKSSPDKEMQKIKQEVNDRNESMVPTCHQSECPHLHPGEVTNQQLQNDIIHLISWLQDELKAKSSHSILNESKVLSSTSLISTESLEQDDRFDSFISTTEVNKDWLKLKEEEQNLAESLNNKTNAINSVHQNILNFWTRHDKSMVQEVLTGRPLKLGPIPASTPPSTADNTTLDSFLSKHSDLLTDFQIVKYKLKNAKRGLQRIQRNCSIQFNEWKKNERFQSGSYFKIKDWPDDPDILSLKPSDSTTKYLSLKDFHRDTNINNSRETMNCETLLSLNECDLSTTLGDLNDLSTSTLVPNIRELVTRVDEGKSRPNTEQTPYWLTGDQEIDNIIIDFYKNKVK